MSINKLSIAFRCSNAVGNSLDLEEMMQEVVKTFVFETDAIFGTFFLKRKMFCQELVSVGKKIDISEECVKKEFNVSELTIRSYDENFDLIIMPLNDGVLIFMYDKAHEHEFILSIFESLRNKLDININACLNVLQLKKKNNKLQLQKEKLEELTSTLQEKVNFATQANLDKEKKIFEQLKMAQMGELIGNIAHQWRQPLSVITTAASGMQLKKEHDLLDDYSFNEYNHNIIKNAEFLSKTIDEFRDYINESHKQKEVVIQERLDMAISMIESSFLMENITIKRGFIEDQKIFFRLVLGDLLQVLISILNNAKDALIQNKVSDKWVKYELHQKEYMMIISIEDSAGGIPEEIMDKIFNPYFTTKHEFQGTGIGLYSAYDIIVNKLQGGLKVENTNHGAKFSIELPLNLNYVI